MVSKKLLWAALSSILFASGTYASENSQFSGSYTDHNGTRSEDKNGNQTSELGSGTDAGETSENTSESSRRDYRMIEAVQKDARIYKATGKVGPALRKSYADYVVASQEAQDLDEEAAPPVSLSQYTTLILR